MKLKKNSILLLICFLFFFVFGLIINSYNFDPVYIRQQELKKNELALIYIGCSSCKFANNDDVINKVINLKSEFIESFSDHDYSLKLIGISNESDVEAGVEYLQQFGKFDEISVGNEMSNTALQKYVWDYYEGLESGGTPQIIIERRIKSIIRNDPTIAYSSKFDSTEIITRIIGLNPIINFDIVSLEL